MPRKARIVVPFKPHHVIQRGNRRQQVFFYPGDKVLYLKLLQEQAIKHDVEILAYCLMDNHVHLILVPQTQEGLVRSVAETNRQFACKINARYDWRGYLWQGRFTSYVMDDKYLLNALRYVENNPVRAGIVNLAWEYLWSSARHHANGTKDALLSPCSAISNIKDWKKFLEISELDMVINDIRIRNINGLPLGQNAFIESISKDFGVDIEDLKPRVNGRPRKT